MNYGLLAFLAVLSMLTALSVDIYLPTVGAIAESFRARPDAVSASLGVFLFSYAIGQLFYGPLTDRFGRLRTLLVGLVLFGAASLLCAYAWSVESFLIARCLQGLVACCGPITAFAVVADVFERERLAKANAYVDSVGELAPMLAPLLGTWLSQAFGWRSCFFFLAGLSVILLAVATRRLRNLPRIASPSNVRAIASQYRAMVAHPAFRKYQLANTFALVALMAFIGGSSLLYMGKMQLSALEYSRLFGLNAAMLAVGGILAARLSDRLGIDRCISLGGTLITVGGTALGLYAMFSPTLAVAPVAASSLVATLGVALILPTSLAGAMDLFRPVAGSAAALLGFSRFAVSGCLTALLALAHWTPVAGLAVGFAVSGLVILFRGGLSLPQVRAREAVVGGSAC